MRISDALRKVKGERRDIKIKISCILVCEFLYDS